MNRSLSWPAALFLPLFLTVAPDGLAQRGSPHVGYVFPAGGQQNSTFEVCVGGQFLDGALRGVQNGASEVIISGEGVEARVIDYCKPPNRGQLNRLRQKLRERQQKLQKEAAEARRKAQGQGQGQGQGQRRNQRRGQGRGQGQSQAQRQRQRRRRGLGLDSLDAKTFKELAVSLRLMAFDLDDFMEYAKTFRDPRRQPNAQLNETVTLSVTIAAGAKLGKRELRLKTGQGLTNPLVFDVGQWRECSESEPQDGKDDESIGESLPAMVNGQIMPGDVDRFVFTARKGMRLVAAATARELMPYLADAVPGWFQATLALYDQAGKRVAYVDDNKFHPDPVLFYQVPENGRYVLEIKDAIYRGREDFVYRIAVGEVPFVTSIFPLGGRLGEQTKIRATGWNLPVKSMILDSKGKAPGVLSVALSKGKRSSNQVPFALDTLSERLEEEPNNKVQTAQKVDLPLIVNGRINRPGDWDIFRFEGRAGQEIVAEIHARRLASPLDSLLRITDANGKQVGINDDHIDAGAGLTTHHADSRLIVKLPATGAYLLYLGDTQQKGGDDYAYRLRISSKRPDFALRIVPASINARPGATVPLTVHALRQDDFSGDIRLYLRDVPRGFKLSGAWIPAGKEKVRFTLTVPRVPLKGALKLSLVGSAMVQGQELHREAVPAEDMMQAFLYRHLVPAEDLMVSVGGPGRGRGRVPLQLAEKGSIKLPAGGSAWVRFTGIGRQNVNQNQFKLELSEPPKGVSIAKVRVLSRGGLGVLLKADAKGVKPGVKGNLMINAFLVRGARNRGSRPRGRSRRIPVGVLPAIPFEIVRNTM